MKTALTALAAIALVFPCPVASSAQAPPELSKQATPCQSEPLHDMAGKVRPPDAFSEAPDRLMDSLNVQIPQMTSASARQIEVIETNAPAYRALLDEATRFQRYGRLAFLLILEDLRVNQPPYHVRPGWYEFVAAKAPRLSKERIDAIAQGWWRVMGGKAVTTDTRGDERDARWEEVRTQFQILRTGTEDEVGAAKAWLSHAEIQPLGKNLTLPLEAQGVSPLAVLLARDIAEEARMYSGQESAKLRKVVACLIANKFDVPAPTAANPDATRRISTKDLDALFEELTASGIRESDARDRLEEWLKKAIESDLHRPRTAPPESGPRR